MIRNACVVLFSLIMLGCNGGSGGGGDTSSEELLPSRISGLVSLGPVEKIRVTVSDPENTFRVTATTDSNGRFGTVDLPADYDGPILILAAGEAGTYFICDNLDGCRSKDNILYRFGEKVPFSGELALYLPSPSAISSQLTLSPFSTAAAARASSLGLNADNIRKANQEMQMMLASMLEPLGLNFSRVYYKYPLLDLAGLKQGFNYEGTDDVSALLTLLASILFNASEPGQQIANLSAEEFLGQLSSGFSADGTLPVSSIDESVMSWEKYLLALERAMSQWTLMAQNDHPASVLLQIIQPLGFEDIALGAQQFLDNFGGISTETISISLTDENIGTNPIATKAIVVEPEISFDRMIVKSYDERIHARLVQDNGATNILLAIDSAAFPGSQNTTFKANLVVGDSQGELRSLFLSIPIQVALDGLKIWATFPSPYERDFVQLSATDNRPNMDVDYAWMQVGGPTVTLHNPNTRDPSFIAPKLTEDSALEFHLEASDSSGTNVGMNITVPITAYADHEELTFDDSNLSTCYTNRINAGAFEDAGAVLDLDCGGFVVNSLAGIAEVINLTSLDVSGDGLLTSLTDLNTLQNLESINVAGQGLLRCADIVDLESVIPGLTVNGASACNRDIWVELSGEGFDTAFDANNGRLFVSLLQDKKIAVIDTQTFRVLRYIDFPAGPRGLSISLDGTRLFAALYGANAVAIVLLSDFSVEFIDLGSWSDSAYISDVLEVQPDRLLVTSGGSSRSRAIQIRLNEGNAISYIANGYSLTDRSIVVADKAQNFAYIGGRMELYKLDLLQPDAPIVLNQQYSADELLLNHDGTKLVTRNGGVLNADTLQEEVILSTSGNHAIGSHPERLYQIGAFSFEESSTFRVFEFDNPQPVAQTTSECRSLSAPIGGLTVLDQSDSDFVWLDGERICGFATRPFDALDSTPEFAVPDPQLEQCIRSEASVIGARTATDITELRCLEFPGITSLRGLERFSNLTSLHIAEGSFFDLSPLEETWWPQSRVSIIGNNSLADISTFINRKGIQELDVTDSKNIPCSQLDVLRSRGVNVKGNGCAQGDRLELGGLGADIVIDESRNRYYVSIPSLQQIKVIDADTFSIIDSINMDGEVTGLALSIDGRQLIATYYDRGVVAYMDIGTGILTEVDVSSLLGTVRAYDVEEVSPGISIVTGGYVVRIDRTNLLSPQQSRVANSKSIVEDPVLVLDRNDGFAYVSEGYSPNSLYKIDTKQQNMPIVLEDEHGKVHDTRTLALSTSGDQIMAGSQRLSTDNFRQTGFTSAGSPAISSNGMLGVHGIYEANATIKYIDQSTLIPLGQRYTGCEVKFINSLPVTPIKASSSDFLIMAADSLCRVPASLPMSN